MIQLTWEIFNKNRSNSRIFFFQFKKNFIHSINFLFKKSSLDISFLLVDKEELGCLINNREFDLTNYITKAINDEKLNELFVL
jgi:hypothetical protein